MDPLTPPHTLTDTPPALRPTAIPPANHPNHPVQKTPLSFLIISGGTGANSFASAFGVSPAFVLPVSDDGGSSSEILRCFGGPSIGDIRSRLIRLIPLPLTSDSKEEQERMAIYNLMSYRFPAEVAEKVVKELWSEVVEGRSELWEGIGEDKKECIRAFLVHFQTLCLRRAHKRFSFRNFSLGNGFLTGARDLFGSLPSAIFLFKAIAGVNEGVQVIPVINTNQTVTIAVQLANSTTLVGQCTISHPTPPPTPILTANPQRIPIIPIRPATSSPISAASHTQWQRHGLRRDSRTFDTDNTSLPSSRRASLDEIRRETGESSKSNGGFDEEEEIVGGNLGYRKGEGEIPLEARIERLFYINLYSQEIFPEPNPDYLEAIAKRDVLVYSCGSLWTSIIPCLALRGLATRIASSKTLKAKVLLLNSMNDRETPGYSASEYVNTILASLRHYDRSSSRSRLNGVIGPGSGTPGPVPWESRALVSHVAYLEGGLVDVDEEAITAMGITVLPIPRSIHQIPEDQTPLFSTSVVEWTMARVMETTRND